MAKLLKQEGGAIKEIQPINASTGAPDAAKVLETNAQGKIDASFLPTGAGPIVKIIEASEGLAAGDFVNIWNDTGAKVRKADASDPAKKADGYVIAAVASAANAEVLFEDFNDQISGATPGAIQFLSATVPGGITETAPTGAGEIVQRLGKAVLATDMSIEIAQPIELA